MSGRSCFGGRRHEGSLYSVVNNIETGRPEYIAIKDMKNVNKLRALYKEGYAQASGYYEDLIKFLED